MKKLIMASVAACALLCGARAEHVNLWPLYYSDGGSTSIAWPGIGKYVVDGINNSDYAVVQGGCMLVAVISVLMNLIVDLLYGALDPRIRY